ncbi:MAG TPA: CoA ester lyase [Chloroflexota bacterium]
MSIARSVLAVPASSWKMIEKATRMAADAVFLDLEDAVAPSAKIDSRKNVVRAFTELDWTGKARTYRVNGLDTPLFYRDIIDVVEPAGGSIDRIVLPKVRRPEDVITADVLLAQVEMNAGLEPGSIGLEAQIESADGLLASEAIARSARRLHSLVFGPGDYAASLRMPVRSIGSMDRWDEQYSGHRFHYAMANIVVAARAGGVRAIDGPVADFRDLDAFRRASLVARGLGYDGKWCIHPSQIAIANEIFSPTAEELEWARTVIEAYTAQIAVGSGALSVGNTMIDAASVELAKVTLELGREVGQAPP